MVVLAHEVPLLSLSVRNTRSFVFLRTQGVLLARYSPSGFVKRRSDVGIITDEPSVQIAQTQKASKISRGTWMVPVLQALLIRFLDFDRTWEY